jgi:cyclophilin family peptidyl-prolyl cis-trans isomerase
MRVGTSIILLFVIASCAPKNFSAVNRFDDPVIRKITQLQDRRDADSLRTFLSNDDVAYRTSAALSLGSVQDSLSIMSLAKVASVDTSKISRRTTAFSLGQTPSTRTSAMLTSVPGMKSSPEFLEAIGKTAQSFDDLENLIPANPEAFSAGHGWMLYRFALNHPFDSIPAGVPANALDPQNPLEKRLAITQFLARGVKYNHDFKTALINCLQQDDSPEVRMNAAFALRRVKDEDVMFALQKASADDADHRVRVNAIRSLQAFPLDKINPSLRRALTDSMTNVAVAASEVIENMASAGIGQDIHTVIPVVTNCRVRSNLFATAAKISPSKQRTDEIAGNASSCGSSYEKAFMIRALQYDSSGAKPLIDMMMREQSLVVKSTATASLVYLFRNNPDKHLRQHLARAFSDAIRQADPAVVSILTEAIADTSLHFREYYPEASFLHETRSKLSLPRDVEAIHPLENAIAVLENKPLPEGIKNPYNHPIDWSIVKTIPSDQKILIETSRGTIIMRLFVDETPGSVANFVSLAEKGYFNDKFFHRVVPNFVVQAGCNRGDGWGSEDYSIRSEFTPRKFTTGSVGMASAGKDTEGTQWFITHSPTPHLDGRYTNFGEVISGMDVVQRLEVGDRIIAVKRL